MIKSPLVFNYKKILYMYIIPFHLFTSTQGLRVRDPMLAAKKTTCFVAACNLIKKKHNWNSLAQLYCSYWCVWSPKESDLRNYYKTELANWFLFGSASDEPPMTTWFRHSISENLTRIKLIMIVLIINVSSALNIVTFLN
jgi:hypothetical protein